MKPLWIENHLPTKPFLSWPVYRSYQLSTAYEYIKMKEGQRAGVIRPDQWETIEQLIDDTSDETLKKFYLIFVGDYTVRKVCDPFGDFAKTILEDFSAIGMDRDVHRCMLRISQWLNDYGAPFALDRPPALIDHGPRFLLDEITLGARHIERIFYDAFRERVMLTNHIVWRSKEIGLVQKLFLQYSEKKIDLAQLADLEDLVPEGINLAAANLYSTAIDILDHRISEYLAQCKLEVKREEVAKKDDLIEKPEKEISVLKPHIQPSDLLSALWLKLNHTLLVKGPIATCDECGRPFRKTREWHVYCPGPCGARARQREHRKPKE